jgi:iron complex outermembrane receptor protein
MNRTFRGMALSCASMIALAAGPAAAQQAAKSPEANVIEEVVITARQRSESLKDVPASVSVLTAQQIAAAGISRADNFIALTPGVSLVNSTAEQGDTQVNIRGINSARDAQNSFAFVLDGVQIANPSAFNREYTDLQQIEIVKGPQGAVYGRSAEAGAMIITTQKPTEETSGLLTVSASNYGSYTAKGRISGALAPNVTASLSGDYRRTDGEFNNRLYSTDALDSYEGGNVNGRLIWQVDAATTLDFKARYGSLKAGSINFNPVFVLPALASVTATPAFAEDVNKHPFSFQNNVPHDNRQDSLELSGKLDHELGWARLTAWGLYSKINNDLLADGTSASFGFFNTDPKCVASTAALFAKGVKFPSPQGLGPTPAASLYGAYTPTTCDGYQYQRRNQEDGSFEARLTSPSDQPLRWLAGVYYLHIDREVGVATGIDSGDSSTPSAPPHALYVPAGQPYSTEQLLWDDFKSNVSAVFGQVQYDVRPDLEASLALRYDSEDRHVKNLVPTAARSLYIDYNGPPYTGGAPLNPALDPSLNPGGISDRSKTYSELQPKIGLRWKATSDWSVYGDWGVGFKSGGFNNQGSRTTIDAFINPVRTGAGFAPVKISDDYKKEVSREYEVGAKGRLFDGKLFVDISAFDNTVDNMQFFEFFVGPFGLLRVVSNIDEVKLQGAELGLQYRATSDLRLEASYAFTDSKIKKNSSRPETVGNKSPYTPDYTWNLAAQYDHELFADTTLHARVDVRGVGPTWFHVVQNQPNPTVFEFAFGALGRASYSQSQRDAYTTVDLRVGVDHKNWTVTAFGQNIFDERYLAEVIPAPEFGGIFISPAQSARYGLEVSYKF